MEDIFPLSSSLLFHSMAEAMNREAPPEDVMPVAKKLSSEVSDVVAKISKSDFLRSVLDSLERRNACFFAGLGSSREVARMTAVRIGHVKRAMGDNIYLSGEIETPAPRIGDILIVISHSGETEITAGLCRNFKRMGGTVASVTGSEKNTVRSLSDISFVV
jgi:6-phospho-3-hexuloisomerase